MKLNRELCALRRKFLDALAPRRAVKGAEEANKLAGRYNRAPKLSSCVQHLTPMSVASSLPFLLPKVEYYSITAQ